MVKGHVFLPKINILSVIFFLLNPKHFVVYGASKKSLSGPHNQNLDAHELTTFSFGVNDLELTTTYRAGNYIWFQRVLIRELPDDTDRFSIQK